MCRTSWSALKNVMKNAMKNLLLVFVMLLQGAAAARAVPAQLTTLSEIHALTNAQARGKISVSFTATVAYSRGFEYLLFLEDGKIGIFAHPPTAAQYQPGDLVLVKGVTQNSFRPIVNASSITVLSHATPPPAIPSTFRDLIRAEHDSMLVSVRATVRSIDIYSSGDHPYTRLELLTDGGQVMAIVDEKDAAILQPLLDAEIDISGVAAGIFDDKMQQTGVLLYVSSAANIKVLKPAAAAPWSLPLTSMDKVMGAYDFRDLSSRVRVQGTITYYQPGAFVVLQDGSRSLWISTLTVAPLVTGDLAEATGFPQASNRILGLTDGEIRDTHIWAPITPLPATWHELGFWSSNSPDGHQNDLVSIEGTVMTAVREASQDEFVLVAEGRQFTAIYRHPYGDAGLAPMKQIAVGSRVRVTGICVVVDADLTSPGSEIPFNILLRSFDDITVVRRPSPLNIRNLTLLVGLLIIGLFVVVARGWALERKVRCQTADLSARMEAEAELERRRSRILEDINGSRSVVEVLEEIEAMVSFLLHGALCWCQLIHGTRPGSPPPAAAGARLIHMEISGRSGCSLGTIFAALDPAAHPDDGELEALAAGARLASLAIDSRRLYSDLRHRSEFDLLTDIHNRFSMDSKLDALIEEARDSAGIFGLVYIDLDKFKQVNDQYGHHIGDLYLQEASRRMKRQLRSHDMLARLGGDEFAVLVSEAHSREDVVEIARRLERCFDAPFTLENHLLHGSASVGYALYPEDGANKDSLLSIADAAMYTTKNSKRRPEEGIDQRADPLLATQNRA